MCDKYSNHNLRGHGMNPAETTGRAERYGVSSRSAVNRQKDKISKFILLVHGAEPLKSVSTTRDFVVSPNET